MDKLSSKDILQPKEHLADVVYLHGEKIPIEITSQMQRYLGDILYLHDEWLGGNMAPFFLIREEIKGEHYTIKSGVNGLRFWRFLREQKAAFAYSNQRDYKYRLTVKDITEVAGETPFIAIAKTHEEHKDGQSPVEMFYLRPGHLQKDLEKLFKQVTPQVQDGKIVNSYLAVRVSNIDFIRELLEKIKLDEGKLSKTDKTTRPEYSKPSKVTLEPLDNILLYKNLKPYTFHQGTKGQQPPRLRLFLSLWRVRRYFKGKTLKLEGEFLNPAALAVQLDITDSPHTFNSRKEDRDNLYSMVKDLKAALKRKGFPIDIIKKNGYQMIVQE